MADHAGAGVGCVPDVAIFDDEALPVTDIRHIGTGVVLLGNEGGGKGAEQEGDG